MDIALDRVQLAYVGGRSVPGNRQHDQEQLRRQRGNGLDLSVQRQRLVTTARARRVRALLLNRKCRILMVHAYNGPVHLEILKLETVY